MHDSETGLSTDMAVGTAKKFLRTIAQPFSDKDQEGLSTWSMRDLEKHQQQQKEEERDRFEDIEMNGNGVNGTNGVNGHGDEFD